MQAPEASAHFIGWVAKIQKFKSHTFLHLRKGYSWLQVIVDGELPTGVTFEAYIEGKGVRRDWPRASKGMCDWEIQCKPEDVKIIGTSESDVVTRCPPDAGSEVKLKERHLYLRDREFMAITRFRSRYIRALREFFERDGMTEISPPAFVGTKCEGGASMFSLKHPPARGGDDIDAYLIESAQFHLEYALPGIGSCWCLAKSFRKEKSHTRRHFTEYDHLECEWEDIYTLEEHMKCLEHMLVGIFTILKYDLDARRYLEDLGLGDRIGEILEQLKDIKIMTHKEAIEYLWAHDIRREDGEKFDLMDDIPEAQERKMIDDIGKIVFLCKFPAHFKSFYMKPCPDDPAYVMGCDVEVPGVGEIIGSGVRAADVETLLKGLKTQGLRPEDYAALIDLRRYGFAQTSGMGLGVDRMLTWILKRQSIREVATYPRYPGHLLP